MAKKKLLVTHGDKIHPLNKPCGFCEKIKTKDVFDYKNTQEGREFTDAIANKSAKSYLAADRATIFILRKAELMLNRTISVTEFSDYVRSITQDLIKVI